MSIRLETSTHRGIENWQGTEISTYNLNWAKEIPKEFSQAKPRTNPSPLYNCHGMTFACRRTSIVKSSSLQDILDDDKYDEIPSREVLPGDIVIYYSQQGDPNHSGIVVENNPPLYVPIICSKWGNAGEFIHSLSHCPKLYGPHHKFFRCKL
jgi:hypothetical protein